MTPEPNSTNAITVTVGAGGASDLAGNALAAPVSVTQAVNTTTSAPADTTAPTLVITDDVPGTANGPVVFTFDFSEAVTGFTASDIVVTGGTAGTLTQMNASQYTLVVTPSANSTTPIGVTVAAGSVNDLAGNALAAAVTVSQLVNTTTPPPADTTAPTLVITDDVPGTANGPVVFTFTFDEAVSGFDVSKVVLSHGTAGAFSKVNDSTYTLVVTPEANSTTPIGVTVAAGSVSDLAGNALAAAVSVSQPVNTMTPPPADTTAPTLVITDDVPGTANGPVVFTFNFDEAVTGFTVGDITVTGGTAGVLTQVNASQYTLVVTPSANSTTPIGVTVAAGSVSDLVGNALAAAVTVSQPVNTTTPPPADTTAPTLVITDDVPGTANGPVVFTFNFDEAVTGFTVGDITVTGGTAGVLTQVNASQYTLVVTPSANSTTPIGVTVAAGSVSDLAGNALAAAVSVTQPVNTTTTPPADTTAPTLVITDNVTGTANGPVVFTFTFDEAVSGFDVSKVVLSHGTAGAFSKVNDSTYTLVVTPEVNSTNAITVTVAAGSVNDLSGNALAAAVTVSQAVDTTTPPPADTTPPTLVITDNVASGAAHAMVTYTFTFSEDVTGFDSSDVTVSHGTKGAFTMVDAHTYTLEVTPPAGAEGADIGVSVGTGLTDVAGNAIAAVTVAPAQPYDTKAPTLPITSYDAPENQTAVVTLAGVDAGAITYSLAGTGADDARFSLSSAGVLSFLQAPDFESPGSAAGSNAYSVVVRMTDASGNSSEQTLTVHVTDVNDAPVVSVPLADQRAAVGSVLSFTIPAGSFTDVDSPSLTYAATQADGSALPSWLVFDPVTRSFSGTPLAGDIGTLSVRVSASDGSLSASDTFDIAVSPAAHIVSVGTDAHLVSGVPMVNSTDSGGLVQFTVAFDRELQDSANALGVGNFILVGADGITPYAADDNFAYQVQLDPADGSHRTYKVSFFIGGTIDESQVHLKFVTDPNGAGGSVRDADGYAVFDHLAFADETVTGSTPFVQSVDTSVPDISGVTLTGSVLADGAISGSEAAGTAAFAVSHAADATKVELYSEDGSTLLATADAANGWNVSIDLSTLHPALDGQTGAGTYEFQVKQYDDGGNVAEGGRGLAFDTHAMQALVTTAVPSSIGAGSYSGSAGAETFAIGGSAQEAGVVTVAWDKDADGIFELIKSVQVTAAGLSAWTVDFTKTELEANAGSGVFDVRFTDVYGNATPIPQIVHANVVI